MKWPRNINTCWQVPYDEWALLNMEDSMFSNAVQGMATSVMFAYVVLLATTHNYLVSLFSIMVIVLVIGTIMTAIYYAGWGIGIAESIALIVYVGFSVDYIVHMCHQYNESVFVRRKNRVDACF